MQQKRRDLRTAVELELEQARYEARLAARRYESVDPDQRLVAAELEARWNAALQKVKGLESKLDKFDYDGQSVSAPNKQTLLSLAQDLPTILNSPYDRHATEAKDRADPDPRDYRRCGREKQRGCFGNSLGRRSPYGTPCEKV